MRRSRKKIVKRKEGNGIITKCQRGTLSKEEQNRLRFIVWDWIPINNFENSVKFEFPYKKRFDKLDDGIDYSSDKVRVIPSRLVNDIEEAIEIYNDYIKSGNEGIILKDSNSVWENKRSKSHIKFKNELDMDLKVVGVQEGLGKYSGLVGSLICESGCGKVKVNVGSGLTDLDRKYLQENSPIGKIVAVKYNEIISDSNGDKSLFLPIFIEIREDKNIADIIK